VTEYLDRDDVLVAGPPPSAWSRGGRLRVARFCCCPAARDSVRSDAYPDVYTKAAALMQSVARNHAFVDGNKRTAWAAAWTFLAINGVELAHAFDVDAAERLVLDVATGEQQSIEKIASALRLFTPT